MGIPIYVISLEGTYRSPSISEAIFYRFGFSLIKVPAVDFRKLNLADVRNMRWVQNVFDFNSFERRHKRSAIPAEIGCLLSHRRVYETIVKAGDDFAVVLEDDFEFDSSFLKTLQEFFASPLENQQPTILTLYSRSTIVGFKQEFSELKKELFRVLNVPYSTCAYVINLKASAILAADSAKADTVADWPNRVCDLSFFYLPLDGIREMKSDSEIHRIQSDESRKSFIQKLFTKLKFENARLAVREFRSFRQDKVSRKKSAFSAIFNYISRKCDSKNNQSELPKKILIPKSMGKYLI